MRLRRELLQNCALIIVAVLSATLVAAVPALAQTSPPVIVSSLGYINGTPQTVHTSNTFNSTGASTLVVFVSSHPAWPYPGGTPVSISGLTDNMGNTFNVLTGPTTWVGSSYALLSTIYYVNAPITSASHTLTVSLTNPAPLVLHAFAISGSDIT